MDNKPDLTGPEAEDFYELVSDLSEGVLRCSYNDHDIFTLLLNKKLNAKFASLDIMDRRYCEQQLDDDVRADGDYETPLMAYLEKFRAWPFNWGVPLTPISELEVKYREALAIAGRADLLTTPST